MITYLSTNHTRNLLYLLSRTLTHANQHKFTHDPHRYSFTDDYEITSFLGKGSTSRVYQGYHILTNREVIVKLFKDIIPQDKIMREIRVNQIICSCNHVIPLVDVVRDPGCGGYGLIFENLHGVPLTHLITNIDFITGLKYIKNILQALQFCHQNHVVHRDLKKSNILITKTGAKLFDFGLAYIDGVHDFVTKRFGTKGYYTPEVMFKTPRFTRKIDIWVCGVIMAEVLAHKKFLMPYSSDDQTVRQIVHYSGYDQAIVDKSSLRSMKRANYSKLLEGVYPDPQITKSAAQIIQKMTNINPQHRPQAGQILKHDIFKNLPQTF